MDRESPSRRTPSSAGRHDDRGNRPPDGRRLSLALLGLTGVSAALATVGYGVALHWAERFLGPSPTRVEEVFVSMRLHGVVAMCCGVFCLLIRRRRHCPRIWARACLIGATGVAIISADRLTGALFPPPSNLNSILEPHPVRGWAHRRDAVGAAGGVQVFTNASGFRAADTGPVPDKRDGELRILFLGDSLTFGYLMQNHDTFAAQTARQLRQPRGDARYECFNAGVGGYATWQELELLKDEGVRAAPDLVVLQFCFNDVSDLVYWDPDKISGLKLPFEFSNMDHWSGLVRAGRSLLSRRRFDATRAKLGFANTNLLRSTDDRLRSLDNVHREPLIEPVRAAWELAKSHLDAFDDWCRSRDLPWVLVVFPMRSQLESFDPAIHPQRYLAEWAIRRNAHHLDLLPAYRRHMTETGRAANELFFDETHPTAAGHRVAAEGTAEYLRKSGLAP